LSAPLPAAALAAPPALAPQAPASAAPAIAPTSVPAARAAAKASQIVETVFARDPAADREKHSAEFMGQMLDPEAGPRFFYRMARRASEARFARMPVARGMPTVPLHGNPIVENIQRTHKATWVEDFDNAGFDGKYGQDLARFLVSLSYYSRGSGSGFLSPAVTDALRDGYLNGLRNPGKGFPGMKKIARGYLDGQRTSTDAYLAADRKKIRAMRESPIAVDDPAMLALLRAYAERLRDQSLLTDYTVEMAGKTSGTTERWDSTLLLLKPKDGRRDRVLLAIKTTARAERRGKTPFGRRVVDAADRFAPGTLLRAAYFTRGGRDYYGYQVSTLKAKVKDALSAAEQAEMAYAVGAELGRGARLSLSPREAGELEEHLERRYADIVAASAQMRREADAAYAAYVTEAAGDP
jgi:hypothetical protein